MRTTLLLLAGMVFAAPSYAGQILGTVTTGGKAIAEGTPVVVECAGQQRNTKTTKFGSYQVNVAQTGLCTFTLSYNNQNPTISITSRNEPVVADFDLQLQDGKYRLVRR